MNAVESIAQVRQFARTNRREVKRFAKFAIVGAAGSVTDFAILNVMIQALHSPLYLAKFCSFTVAVIQNFLLNRHWTFPESRDRAASHQLAKFTIVSIIGLVINLVVFLTVHHALEAMWMQLLGPDVGFSVSYNFANLFATGVVLFWNFSANRLWTYRGL